MIRISLFFLFAFFGTFFDDDNDFLLRGYSLLVERNQVKLLASEAFNIYLYISISIRRYTSHTRSTYPSPLRPCISSLPKQT
jgi:hypothetical protein